MNLHRLTTLPLLISMLCLSISAFAQQTGTALIIAKQPGEITIDGEAKGAAKANSPEKFTLSPGEHYVQFKANGQEFPGQVVVIEAGRQKIIKFEAAAAPSGEPARQGTVPTTSRGGTAAAIGVAKLNFKIPGSIVAGSWQAEHPDEEFPDNPNFYYAFEKGDEIVLNFRMQNKNGKNVIKVSTYPGGTIKYSNQSFQHLDNVRIKVEKRSIYRFSIATNAALARNATMDIQRIPASASTQNFNPNITWATRSDTLWESVSEQVADGFQTVTVQQVQKFYINSTSNETWKGGQARVLVPVKLPPNTINWYYEFSASRNESEINRTAGTFDLAGQVANLLDQTGIVSFGINLLTQPPGSDQCDVYLLSADYYNAFRADNGWRYQAQGSRENLVSGVVRVEDYDQGTWYLGIRNTDTWHGIHVAIEVVAVTAQMRTEQRRKIKTVRDVRYPVMGG